VSLRLRLYLATVGLLAVVLLGLHLPPRLEVLWPHYAAWVLVIFFSEMLWSRAPGGGTWSLSSTAGLATVVLWGPAPALWIVGLGTLAAELLVLRKPPVRAAFNASQITITIWASALIFTLLGGPAAGVAVQPALAHGATAWRLVVPWIGLMAIYLVVNRALVSVAVAWSTDRPYLTALREDWFYQERLLEDAAAFLMSPLMVIAYTTIGYPGVVLFYVPLHMLLESDRRFVELREAQERLVRSEVMAAMGEMARGIGHELNNQLVPIHGRAQMLLRDAERDRFQNVARHAQIILEQSQRMAELSTTLRDFGRTKLTVEAVDMNALIGVTKEFVRTQNRFDAVEWDVRLREDLPLVKADKASIQRVLINLFLNAADAMGEGTSNGQRVISVVSDWDERAQVTVRVSDTGPGIPATVMPRLFTPNVTSKTKGTGLGLSTSHHIVEIHSGSLVAENLPGSGACFTMTLPVEGPGKLEPKTRAVG
jgi:signal transduction histidine kinase